MSDWHPNMAFHHAGEIIRCVEENGRRFFTASVPDPGGWSLQQEFGSLDDARRYIDRQHADQAAWEAPHAL